MEHNYKSISDIGTVITGKTPSTDVEEYFDGEFPFITPSDIHTYDEKYLLSTERTLSIAGAQVLKGNKLPEDSICFVCIGSTIGKMCKTNQVSYTNQQINSIIPKSMYDSDYIFYYLRYVKSYFQSVGGGTGSGKGIVNKTLFSKTKLDIIEDTKSQREVASILSTYDSLIESNNKRIKILEQMAENLYKEWFVRFRFPGHETAEFENGIPKGWEIGEIGEYYNTSSGGTPSTSNPEYYNGDIPWVKTGELQDSFVFDTEEHITKEAISHSSAKMIKAGSLLLAMYAGTNVGKMGFVMKECTCNQACCVLTEKVGYSLFFLFETLKLQRDYLQNISFGAAQQNISQQIIKKVKILFPRKKLVEMFSARYNLIADQIKINLQQNNNLIKQRDLLLPRLMSGKLEV